ncbi:MAG: YebC/PmpR family DNA-binding transcriptional regulator [Leptolyngbyaceae bacterium]|nr:YebC/PmpR family DNA-binding transcriptional regulator [Leptolyngbyaceae bacterium]
MAGHSQFKNIMRRKGAQDIKRGKIFTKIAREMMVAAKAGPDINFNAKLRAVVIKARQAGMAKDKIDAAIAKGSGTGSMEAFETVRYEGYGPGGVAMIVEALTDNRNRTAADVRSIFTKNGGTMGESGSVGFMFSHVGLIEYSAEAISEEVMLEAAIEAGAENCETTLQGESGGTHTITTSMESLHAVREALGIAFGDPLTAKFTFLPTITTACAGDTAAALMELVEALEDNDDVQEVFTNADFPEAVLAKLAS